MKRKTFLPAIGFLTLGILGISFAVLNNRYSNSPTGVAHEIPDFKLKTSKNEEFFSHSLKGKFSLIHFWASWCDPCVEEVPELLALSAKMTDLNFKIIAISMDKDWEDAHKLLAEDKRPANVISLLDAPAATPNAFGSFQYPESYLVGPDQKIIMKWVGPQNWGKDEFVEILKKRISH